MNGYALDSDTVSFLLRRQENVRRRLDLMVARNIDIVIPPYVYYEIQRWLNLTRAAAKQKQFDSLYAKTGITPLDHAALDRAAAVYASLTPRGIVIGDADILIAANLYLVRRLAPHT